MGLFSSNSDSGLEQRIDKVTSDSNTSEDWSLILDVCDRIKESPEGSKEGLRIIKQRINSSNPRVSLQAITLLDACVNNCGNKFLLEVASREFEQDLKKLITSPKTHKKVADSLRQYLKAWAEGEFKSDRQLALIPDLYKSLRHDGYDFNSSKSSSKKKTVEYSNDPNVVNNKQEEDDIAQAIALSLQSAKQPSSSSYSSNSASKSLYGDLSSDLASNFDSAVSLSEPKETGASSSDVKKARALYDFEAVEDNELTFKAGELIVVLDSSDANWWKGSNQVGEGLFPANFVTLDINGPEQEDLPSSRSEKRVSFNESVKVTELTEEEVAPREEVTGEIDETKVDYLLHLLHESDPTGERPDPSDLPNIEDHVNAMAPTIDTELEQIDRKHNELSRLNNDLMGALDLYHQLMREMPVNYYPPPQQHPSAMYGGRMPYPQGYAPPMHIGPHPGGAQGSPHHQSYGGPSFPPSQPPTTQEGIPPHTMMAPPMHGGVPQHGHPMVPVSHNGSYPPTSVNGMHPPPPMMMMHQQSSGNAMKNNPHPHGGEFYHAPHQPPTSAPPPHGMYPHPQGQPLM